MKIVLGVTGCIAAYKAIEVMRGLQKAGHGVQVVLTNSATHFVTPLTFEALSREAVITDMFQTGKDREILHIHVAQAVGLLAVVPATANILGKFARGIADDFLSTLYLSCPAPVLLAPAMNVEMWHHPAVRENVEILRRRGHHFVDPEPGELACGMQGEGRLAEVEAIVSRILALASPDATYTGLRVLVTAGPTIEDLDPVRYISNRSSGRMGYAIAQAALQKGADVYLVSGPSELNPPAGATYLPVRSAAEMKETVLGLYPKVDMVFKAAAVADYRPAQCSPQKIKKGKEALVLALTPTDDILSILGREKKHQILVGFAAETEDVIRHAREKMQRKNLDMVVANDVSADVFGSDSTSVHLVSPDRETITISRQSKLSVAARILDTAREVLDRRKAQWVAE